MLASRIFRRVVCDRFVSSFSAFISFYAIGYTLCLVGIGTVALGCKRLERLVPKIAKAKVQSMNHVSGCD